MKNILIINGDLNKSEATQMLIDAYVLAATQAESVCKQIAIVDLLFNQNKMFASHMKSELETDLLRVERELKWAHHIVVFCPVFENHIPAKVASFISRVFDTEPLKFGKMQAMGNYFGKSVRIVSILDEPLFEKWRNDPKINYMSIKRSVFEQCRMSPIHTCTLGAFHSLNNAYAQKWAKKMSKFGSQGI